MHVVQRLVRLNTIFQKAYMPTPKLLVFPLEITNTHVKVCFVNIQNWDSLKVCQNVSDRSEK